VTWESEGTGTGPGSSDGLSGEERRYWSLEACCWLPSPQAAVVVPAQPRGETAQEPVGA
jgi:hypothetical protein